MPENVEATSLEIGRLLNSAISGFTVGTRASNLETPNFGALVRAPLGDSMQIYGLIFDITIDDDGLIRQLATSENIQDSVIEDNRTNRNMPLEISVMAIGHSVEGQIRHLLPPRPPLSLDIIYLCGNEEIRLFTSGNRFSYFRHILRNEDLPISELLATHIQQANQAHLEAGNTDWVKQANKEIVTLLRDDYDKLMPVLAALADTLAEG